MSIKVLIADDSGVMRAIMVRSLNSLGITDIVQAVNGQKAFEAFEAYDFQLVLTDWNMPRRNGLELVKDIRATGSNVPIMMITTEDERDRVIEALQAGATDYLAKPFTADTLREKLKRLAAPA